MLKDLIIKETPAIPFLPVAHLTSWHNLTMIIEGSFLKTISKFKTQSVSYFFYGVPFYKLNLDDPQQTCSQLFRRPIGILFKSKIIERAKRAFPFDTGAFGSKMFKEFFPDDSSIEEFEIPINDPSTPAKLVTFLYGNNTSYIFGGPLKLDQGKNILEDCLIHLISTRDIHKFDERNHAIEIQFNIDLPLKENIELMIFPREMYKMHFGRFGGKLSQYKIEFYEDSYRFDPLLDSALVQAKAKEYLRKNNYIE
jgi:hypothetical protein